VSVSLKRLCSLSITNEAGIAGGGKAMREPFDVVADQR
jgi:hypothetical protein